MKLRIEFELGLGEMFKDLKRFIGKAICKRKGHAWEKEEEYFFPSIYELYYGGKITHRCKRCDEVKRETPKAAVKKVKIKKVDDLTKE